MAAKKKYFIQNIDGVLYKQCTSKFHEGEKLVEIKLMAKKKKSSDGLDTFCNFCRAKYGKSRRQTLEFKIKYRKYLNENRLKNRIKNGMAWAIWSKLKRRAKAEGVLFSLKLEDVVIPDNCPVLGIPLIKDVEYLRKNNLKTSITVPNYPSVDRFIPSKGYVKENINIISWRANNIKHNASLDEIEAIFNWMKNKQKYS